MSLFGGAIEMLRQAAVFSTRRHELLAQNIANAGTPGVPARDLSFAHELSLAQQANISAVQAVKAMAQKALELGR